MIFAAGVAAAVVALIVAAGGGAAGRAERPPAGFLIGIRGTGGCVGQAGVQPGHGADYPAKDDCAAGRGLRQVHHIALSPDERFVYTAAGLVANPPDDDGAIDVFRRRADGSIMQLPGAHGCVKRPHPVEGREGCGVARGIEGARFIVRSADGRFLYVGSPTGIAISTRDTRSGTLRQLRGTAGCISQDRAQPCARAKAVNTIEDIALSADQRWRTRSPTTTTRCSPSVATRAREHCAKWTASPSLGGRLIRRRPAADARVPSTGPGPGPSAPTVASPTWRDRGHRRDLAA